SALHSGARSGGAWSAQRLGGEPRGRARARDLTRSVSAKRVPRHAANVRNGWRGASLGGGGDRKRLRPPGPCRASDVLLPAVRAFGTIGGSGTFGSAFRAPRARHAESRRASPRHYSPFRTIPAS